MAKKTKQDLKEFCVKCGSKEFSIAEDDKQFRYCAKCNNVWIPMSRDQLELEAVRNDNILLKSKLDMVTKELQLIKKKYMSSIPANKTDMFE